LKRPLAPLGKSNGKRGPGRPGEDRFIRKMEIYAAVAPLILERGARRLTMQEAAYAACLSMGGLYHYFGSKRELVLYPMLPGVCEEAMRRFEIAYGHLRESDPKAYLDVFIEEEAESVFLVRPAVYAALELGAEDFWRTLEGGAIVEDISRWVRAIQGGSDIQHDPDVLARSIRRLFMAALLDRSITPDEVRADLRALIQGEPLRPHGVPLFSSGIGIDRGIRSNS
jgi:AcrR family transcriptional regulator